KSHGAGRGDGVTGTDITAIVPQVTPTDGVERLHTPHVSQVLPQQLTGGGAVLVEGGEVPVPLGVVVVGVDHDGPGRDRGGHLLVAAERYGHHYDFPESSRVFRGGGVPPVAEFLIKFP